MKTSTDESFHAELDRRLNDPAWVESMSVRVTRRARLPRLRLKWAAILFLGLGLALATYRNASHWISFSNGSEISDEAPDLLSPYSSGKVRAEEIADEEELDFLLVANAD